MLGLVLFFPSAGVAVAEVKNKVWESHRSLVLAETRQRDEQLVCHASVYSGESREARLLVLDLTNPYRLRIGTGHVRLRPTPKTRHPWIWNNHANHDEVAIFGLLARLTTVMPELRLLPVSLAQIPVL